LHIKENFSNHSQRTYRLSNQPDDERSVGEVDEKTKMALKI
jgi:hypothetical protein